MEPRAINDYGIDFTVANIIERHILRPMGRSKILLNTVVMTNTGTIPALMNLASFMTPLSRPADFLEMDPGGYRFVDYIKVLFPIRKLVRPELSRGDPSRLRFIEN